MRYFRFIAALESDCSRQNRVYRTKAVAREGVMRSRYALPLVGGYAGVSRRVAPILPVVYPAGETHLKERPYATDEVRARIYL